MAKFESKVMVVESSLDHPNADRLSIVKLEGYSYQIISGKLEDGSHRYKAGDLVVYVQEGSLVPEYLLRQGYWNEKTNQGILAGKAGNRVKPITLRGVLSEGIMFSVDVSLNPLDPPGTYGNDAFVTGSEGDIIIAYGRIADLDDIVGQDVSEALSITKWEPEIPVEMMGQVHFLGQDKVLAYDIENIKKWPDAFSGYTGRVFLTEKLHGTFAGVGFIPGLNDPEIILGEFFAFSKGLGAKGLVFKHNNENANNLYNRTILEKNVIGGLQAISRKYDGQPVYVLGEIFGKGVQDLHYGADKPDFRAFEVYIGLPGKGFYVDASEKYELLDSVGIKTVPIFMILDKFDQELVEEISTGKSTFGENIREGVVLIPEDEQNVLGLGRLILKSISPAYLNRKNGTEYT